MAQNRIMKKSKEDGESNYLTLNVVAAWSFKCEAFVIVIYKSFFDHHGANGEVVVRKEGVTKSDHGEWQKSGKEF